MKKLLTLLLIVPTFASAQETKKHKFSVGVSAGLNQSYRTLKPDGQSTSKAIALDRNSTESPLGCYTFGANVAYKINRSFSIESGVMFSARGEKEVKDLRFQDMLDPLTGTIIHPEDARLTYKYRYQFIDVPLKITYGIGMGKFRIYASAGISTNFYFNSRVKSVFEQGGKTSTSSSNYKLAPINNITLGMSAGVGASYDLRNRMTVRLQPEYYRDLTSMVYAPIKQYNYTMGISAGFFYKF